MEKSIREPKAKFVCMCVREREKATIFKVYEKMQISHSKRILNLQNFLPKYPFSFTLETVLKMAKETSKGDVESICAIVTKHASKKGGES